MEHKKASVIFGHKLKLIREQYNQTQAQLAEKLNVTQQTVASWENGRTEPSMTTIIEIADMFDVGVQYFYDRDDGEDGSSGLDPKFIVVQRNAKKMTEEQFKKMYTLLKLSFDEFDWNTKKPRAKK